ncbi:MAG: hypothetical protein WCI27_07015 [Candidatus Omnitrophota bacterium]
MTDKLKEKVSCALKNNNIDVEYFSDSVERFYQKIAVLNKLKDCNGLIKSLLSCNDQNNLKALIFEASFAFDILSKNGSLKYEVQQGQNATSIDFLCHLSGDDVYFELRLVQENINTRETIKDQLEKTNHYSIAMDGGEEQKELLRLQTILIEKCFKDGRPVKFFYKRARLYNIVVVYITDLILGAIDCHDCKLVAYGDAFVEPVFRRGISGLFNHDAASNKSDRNAFKDIISGILFVRNSPRATSLLDLDLEYLLMHNPTLFDKTTLMNLASKLSIFMKTWSKQT